MERLIVKNFGPLKDVDIELNRINLFIGENGSGKSVLGKLVTIVTTILELNEEKVLKKIIEYNIDFINEESVIQFFSDNTLLIELKENKIKVDLELKETLLEHEEREEPFDELLKKIETINIESKSLNSLFELFHGMKNYQESLTSQYIPSERNLISLFNQSIYSFLSADIALPKFLLSFFSEFEKARKEIKKLSFLDVKYVHSEKDKIYYDEDDFLHLEHSSSGIQSALPLYLTVKYFARRYRNIIIEEPEQNLFPKGQKETVEYIVGELGKENKLFMMTHSPYILTALNNLILANDVKEQKGIEALKGIIEEKYCVSFEEVSAYSLFDGKSVNIMDKEDRIIGVNVIDSISDEVSETFDKLLAKLD